MTGPERDKLIEENLNLVWYTMRTYYPNRFTRDNEQDFFQIGCLGLIQAASTYDEHPDLAFSTYAVNTIRSHINHQFLYLNRKQQCILRRKFISPKPRRYENHVFRQKIMQKAACQTANVYREQQKQSKRHSDNVWWELREELLALLGNGSSDLTAKRGQHGLLEQEESKRP